MVRNEAHTSIRYARRSPEVAFVLSLDGPMLFFRGRDETLLPLPVYERIPTNNGALEVGNIFPSLIPAEDHYDNMATWQEA